MVGSALGLTAVAVAIGLVPAPRWWIVAVAAVFGAVVDTVAGALLQQQRWCPASETATEQARHACGTNTRHRSGWRWLGNDQVNLLCTASAAVLAWRLASLACLARVCRRAVRRARCRPPGRGHSGKNHSDRPGAPSAGRVRVGAGRPDAPRHRRAATLRVALVAQHGWQQAACEAQHADALRSRQQTSARQARASLGNTPACERSKLISRNTTSRN